MNCRKLNNDLPLAWETRDSDLCSMHDRDDAPSESVEGKAIVDCHYENALHTIVIRWGKKWRGKASSSGRLEYSGSRRSRPTNCNSFYESSAWSWSCVCCSQYLFLSCWRVFCAFFSSFFCYSTCSLSWIYYLCTNLCSLLAPLLSFRFGLNFADIFLFFLLLLFSLSSRFSSFFGLRVGGKYMESMWNIHNQMWWRVINKMEFNGSYGEAK